MTDAPERERFFADGGFYTADRKARFVPTRCRVPIRGGSGFPLVLNTGRIRDQWHTMTRTARTPRLMSHIAEPFVEVHPRDATRFALVDASLAHVTSEHGSVIVRVMVTSRQRQGSVFVPMHWTDQFSSAGRVDALVRADVDPVSGQPALKGTSVRIEPFDAAWYGYAVMRSRPAAIAAQYWAVARAKAGWRVELAGMEAPADWSGLARRILLGDEDTAPAAVEFVAYHDTSTGQHRIAAFAGDRLMGALFAARTPVPVARGWAAQQLEAVFGSPEDRLRLLAGRAGGAVKDRGAIVCACFEVGINEIAEAVTTAKCDSIAAIGATLKAGSNCGSCRAEIGRIVHAARLQKTG